jgi:hypothetical protein
MRNFREPVKVGRCFEKFDFRRSVEKVAERRRSPKRCARFNDCIITLSSGMGLTARTEWRALPAWFGSSLRTDHYEIRRIRFF